MRKKIIKAVLFLTIIITIIPSYSVYGNEIEPLSNKHTYRTVYGTPVTTTRIISAEEASTTQGQYDAISEILGQINQSLSYAWDFMSILTGMGNVEGKIETTTQRITKYQTYLPSGNTTVMWRKLKITMTSYKLNSSGSYTQYSTITRTINL